MKRALCVGCASLALLLALCALASDETRMLRTMQAYGDEGVRSWRDWRQIIFQSQDVSELEQLRRVNEFFNRRIIFQDDNAIWQQPDYWATPLETLGRGAGDCEDFAVAKYFSLVELGVSKQKLRLTYVRARIGAPGGGITQAHMVVSYYVTPEAEPLVLDNLIRDIRPASRRPDLTPVFSFNSDGVWLPGAPAPSSSVDRLSRWKAVIARIRAEG